MVRSRTTDTRTECKPWWAEGAGLEPEPTLVGRLSVSHLEHLEALASRPLGDLLEIPGEGTER